MSKGSRQRPSEIDSTQFSTNWDQTFAGRQKTIPDEVYASQNDGVYDDKQEAVTM